MGAAVVATFLNLLLLIIPLIISGTTTLTKAGGRPFRKVFAFGDSFTDTGNTVSTTGPTGFNYVSSLPYGMTFFHRPTNRYSDGRLVIDFVAQSLSLPFLPPYKKMKMKMKKLASSSRLGGVNFAVAGSTAIPHSFFAKNNMSMDITPESLGTQLSWFNDYLKLKDELELEDALVWVGEIGVNDYAYSFASSTVSTSTVQTLALNTVSRFLEAIIRKGAKYMVVQGLPPTGCLTLTLTLATDFGDTERDALGCVASNNRLIRTHNTLLQDELHRLRKQHPDVIIVYADYWDAYEAVLQNPAHYGMKERFRACCGDGGHPYNFTPLDPCGSDSATACQRPSEYINWDGVHLTEAMYRAVSQRFLDGPSCRPSFQYLLSKRG